MSKDTEIGVPPTDAQEPQTPEQSRRPEAEASTPAGEVVTGLTHDCHDATEGTLVETHEDAAQREGFRTVEEYKTAIRAGNARAREMAHHFIPNALNTILYTHNGENPHGMVLCECADGRCGGPEMFSQNADVRFTKTWKPQAGLLMDAELVGVNTSDNPGETLEALLADPTRRTALFDRMEDIFGENLKQKFRVAEAATLAGRRLLNIPEPEGTTHTPEIDKLATFFQENSGATFLAQAAGNPLVREKLSRGESRFPITIELQSHSDPEHPDHGCGAWGSKTNKALDMTVVNALALEAFLRERYPQFAADTRIAVTHHYTGKNDQVVSAYRPELFGTIDPSLQARMTDATGRRFEARFQKDPENGVVRIAKKNPFKIDQHHHDEYIIRLSEVHKATALEGTSVLEQSMLPDTELMKKLALKLISIAQANRIARDAKKGKRQPIFFRLDQPEGDAAMCQRYADLHTTLLADTTIQDLIASGDLFIVRTQTRPFRYQDPDRLKTTFLDADGTPEPDTDTAEPTTAAA